MHLQNEHFRSAFREKFCGELYIHDKQSQHCWRVEKGPSWFRSLGGMWITNVLPCNSLKLTRDIQVSDREEAQQSVRDIHQNKITQRSKEITALRQDLTRLHTQLEVPC